MTIKLSPIGNDAPFYKGGVAASGCKLFVYNAGSTTKATTYTDNTGNTQNANPIILNSEGYPASGGNVVEIWVTTGASYKFVLAPSTDTDPPGSPIWTRDNVAGINDASLTLDEWVSGPTPTYVSGTQFTLVGDQTNSFHVGRRIKYSVTAGTGYATISASAFAALTTVTVDSTGSIALDSGLSAISYGLNRADNFTQSVSPDSVNRQSKDIASAATINLDAAGGDYVHVTGSTGPVTAITLSRGHHRVVVFDSTPTLTNGASLILPTGANITAAAGDVAIFRGEASGVVRAVGYMRANGQPLLGGALVLIQSQDASASASINFTTGIDGTYDEYELHISGYQPASSQGVLIRGSSNGGSSYDSGANYEWSVQGGSASAATADSVGVAGTSLLLCGSAALVGAVVASSTETAYFIVRILKPSTTSLNKVFDWAGGWTSNEGTPRIVTAKGTGRWIQNASAMNAFQVLSGSGNITAGKFTLYGVKKS